MGVRVIWKDFDPRVQRIHLVYGTLGPRLDRYRRRDELLHYYVLFPYTTWVVLSEGFQIFHSIVGKIARDAEKELTEKERRILDELDVIHIPEEAYESMRGLQDAFTKEWKQVSTAFNDVMKRVLGREPFQEIFVYPAFTFKNWDGTAYQDVIVLATEPGRKEIDTSILVHEMIHPVIAGDGLFERILIDLGGRKGLPAEEAFTQTITNLVLWRAGITEEMFGQYYDPNWDEMKALEDKMREIVREWWVNGGDLRKMLEGRLRR